VVGGAADGGGEGGAATGGTSLSPNILRTPLSYLLRQGVAGPRSRSRWDLTSRRRIMMV